MFEGQYVSLPIVVRVEQVDVSAPSLFTSFIRCVLVPLVVRVTGDPDTIVRDHKTVLNGRGALTPLEVKDVVGNVVPVLANIFSVVEFFVNAAGFVLEFSAGSPGGSHSPGTLGRMEQEFLDAFA